MHRRNFLSTLALGTLASQLACAAGAVGAGAGRRLRRVGIQLYSLRDDARKNFERTLGEIAAIGYKDIELLGSFNNFDVPAPRLRQILDRNGLRAASTHVGGDALDSLDRQLDEANALGQEYIIVASLPIKGKPTLDDYRRWADRLNEAGRRALTRNVWIGFHNHAGDLAPIDGVVPYDILLERTEAAVVRHQLDTGNMAMAGRDPFEYLKRYASRYWSFHIKDVPSLGAKADVELSKGMIDFRRFLASIDRIEDKFLFVEQETYPGAPIDSVRRDFEYISRLEF